MLSENCTQFVHIPGPVRTIIRKVLVRNPDGTTRIVNETTTIQSKPEPQPQKIQVLRQPDGKLSVRGLQPNQKLVQTQDGKYLILPANSNGESSEWNLQMQKRHHLTLNYFIHSCWWKSCASGTAGCANDHSSLNSHNCNDRVESCSAATTKGCHPFYATENYNLG